MYIIEQVFVEFKVFKYEAEVKKVPYATCFPLTREQGESVRSAVY